MMGGWDPLDLARKLSRAVLALESIALSLEVLATPNFAAELGETYEPVLAPCCACGARLVGNPLHCPGFCGVPK